MTEVVQAEPCGAQAWGWADDLAPNGVWLYGTCGDAAGHEHRYHHEYDGNGKLWAEWSGNPASRIPADSRVLSPSAPASE